MKKGFTLIELIIVVAIIAIVSTLAVSKFGNVREKSSLQVSIANQKAIERAVAAFLASGGQLDKLDGLTYASKQGESDGGPANGFQLNEMLVPTMDPSGDSGMVYRGPVGDEKVANVRANQNCGLMPALWVAKTGYLCRYSLNATEVSALNSRIGLKFLMRHYPEAYGYPSSFSFGDDGSVPNASDGLNANDSACIANVITNGMYVLAVNPMTHLGRTIYQACGQQLLSTKLWGKENYDESVTNEVAATGGPLLAFGLGDSATIIGSANAGLESAPYSTYTLKKHYTRYLLLFRVRQAGSGSVSMPVVELAGVLDCCGNTIRAAEHVLKSL